MSQWLPGDMIQECHIYCEYVPGRMERQRLQQAQCWLDIAGFFCIQSSYTLQEPFSCRCLSGNGFLTNCTWLGGCCRGSCSGSSREAAPPRRERRTPASERGQIYSIQFLPTTKSSGQSGCCFCLGRRPSKQKVNAFQGK